MLPEARKRPLDGAGVHMHPEFHRDGAGQAGRFQGGVGSQLLLRPGQDLPGELVAAAPAAPCTQPRR